VGLTVAALYDVHGNLPALEAVLLDLAAEPPDVVVFGGDLVWGPWPSETLQRAQGLGASTRFVRGNTETLILERAGEHRWAHERLSHDERATLASWPLTLLSMSIGSGRRCSATPRQGVTRRSSSPSLRMNTGRRRSPRSERPRSCPATPTSSSM
jgi:hypothetical protein